MLEIKKDAKVHKATIYGKALLLTEPSYKQSRDYSKKLKDLSEEEQADELLVFLEGLGLPKDISEELTSSEIEQVCNLLMPAKKK